MPQTDPVSVRHRRFVADVASCPRSYFPRRERINHAPRDAVSGTAGGRPVTALGATPILALVLALLATAGSSAALPAEADAAPRLDRTERKVVKLVNSYRARHGRPRLRTSGRLNRVADRHSRAMIAHDFFAHSSRNGTAASTRVRRSSKARSVGETLAFVGAGQNRTARRVVSMWIDSAPHRAVLLNRSFRRIGVGRRGGNLAGSNGDAFTADFASRR